MSTTADEQRQEILNRTSVTADVHRLHLDKIEAVVHHTGHVWITLGPITFHFDNEQEMADFSEAVADATENARRTTP